MIGTLLFVTLGIAMSPSLQRGWRRCRRRPGSEVTTRQACNGSQPESFQRHWLDMLLIKPSWWARGRRRPPNPTDRSRPRHPARVRRFKSHARFERPPPTLPASPRPATTNTYRRFTVLGPSVLSATTGLARSDPLAERWLPRPRPSYGIIDMIVCRSTAVRSACMLLVRRCPRHGR